MKKLCGLLLVFALITSCGDEHNTPSVGSLDGNRGAASPQQAPQLSCQFPNQLPQDKKIDFAQLKPGGMYTGVYQLYEVVSFKQEDFMDSELNKRSVSAKSILSSPDGNIFTAKLDCTDFSQIGSRAIESEIQVPYALDLNRDVIQKDFYFRYSLLDGTDPSGFSSSHGGKVSLISNLNAWIQKYQNSGKSKSIAAYELSSNRIAFLLTETAIDINGSVSKKTIAAVYQK